MKNTNKNRVFRFKRRIRGLTNYHKRFAFVKSGLTRIVIRKANNSVIVQFVDYETKSDKVICCANTCELIKLGFNLHKGNIVSAYLTGYLAGKKALKNKITKDCIVDLGLQRKIFGTRIYATIKGIVDSGIKVKVDKKVFPDEKRLNGEHLKNKKDVLKVIENVKLNCDKIK